MNYTKYKIILLCCMCSLITHRAVAQEKNTESSDTLNTSSFSKLLNDEINTGFTSTTKRQSVGAIEVAHPLESMKKDNTQWVRSAIEGQTLGLKGSANIRGLGRGSALIVVDGIPGRDIDLLNMEEIEEITILKDSNAAALYGSMARNGVILVKTKRGKVGQKVFNISASAGVKKPTAMPEYLGAADYMELYNKARTDDGFSGEYYSAEEIENHRSGINPYRYADVDFYSDEYFKTFTEFTNVTADFSGGVNNTTYYVNLGFKSDGEIQDISENDKGVKRFNVRANIDFHVNSWIKSSLDVMGLIQHDRSSHTNLYKAAQDFRPNLYAPMLPVSIIDTTGNPTLAGQVQAANQFHGHLIGGKQAYAGNVPLANIHAGGYNTSISRISQMNNAIDFDLSKVAKGLSAKTYVSFDFYSMFNQSITNKYAVYEPTWSDEGTIIGLTNVKDPDKKDQTEHVKTNDFIIRYGFYGQLNYDRTFAKKHHFNSSLIGFSNSTLKKSEKPSDSDKDKKEEKQTARNSHVALNMSYSFNDRFYANFSGAYMSSIKLAEGNRGKFSPTAGIGYILYDDNNQDSPLNFFKLKASGGVIYSDMSITDYFLYDEVYSQAGGGFSWGDINKDTPGSNNQATKIIRGANPLLAPEKRTDLNLGFEAILFNKLWVEGNVYQTTLGDQVQLGNSKYPSYYKNFNPYTNDGEQTYNGFELGIEYKNNIGKLNVDLGARVLYAKSEFTKVDEIFENDYEYKKGTSITSIRGLQCEGFFEAKDFDEKGRLVEGIPEHFGTVRPGDLKYTDMNGDKVIDDKDKVVIGDYASEWSFGTDITLNYGNFTLFALITAELGGEAMLDGDYYQPQGISNYSKYALNSWTEETAATATLPRLTTFGSTNNFDKPSTFWLYDNSSINISRVQLTYDMPAVLVNGLKMDGISLFGAASNLYEFSKNKEYRELNLEYGPHYRYYTLGLRLKF